MDDVATLQAEIDSLRTDYREANDRLFRGLATLFADPNTAAIAMLSKAEEFGPSVAAEQMMADPNYYGLWSPTTTDELYASQCESIEKLLEAAIDIHDRLDQVTAQREALLTAQDPTRPTVIHMGGREMAINIERGEIRFLDEPGKLFRLPLVEMMEQIRAEEPSITERYARDMGAPKAEPDPSRARNRGR